MALGNVNLTEETTQAANDICDYFFDRYNTDAGLLDPINAISALGAVSGAFAHRQALAMLQTGLLPEKHNSFAKAETKSGETFWFGDALNYVVFEAITPDLSLFSLVAPAANVPDPFEAIQLMEILRHTAQSVGSPAFAALRPGVTPQPTERILDALAAHLPPLRERLGDLDIPLTGLVTVFGTAAQAIIPICAGENPEIFLTAPLNRVKAVQLFFEAAIPTSKLDPGVTGA